MPGGASECVEFPVVISYDAYDFIVMPPGSNPAMPRHPFLQRLGVALSIAGFVFDIAELIQMMIRQPFQHGPHPVVIQPCRFDAKPMRHPVLGCPVAQVVQRLRLKDKSIGNQVTICRLP